jgi:hypothetical protein
MYIWQLPAWPAFRWYPDRLSEALAIAHRKERQLGRHQELRRTDDETAAGRVVRGAISNRVFRHVRHQGRHMA